jgi:hypothetical protein
MTPERMAGLVARWVRLYTRGLPGPTARRRIEEIDADLHDHIAHERDRGTDDGQIARSIGARMVRGLAADVSWRRTSTRKDPMKKTTPALRIALVTALVLLVPLFGMQVSDGVDWGVFDFVFAAVLLVGAGMLLELTMRRPRSIAYRAAAGAVGVAAIVLGEADDAPGLMLFGCLLILGSVALAVRTAQRSGPS